MSQWTGTTFDSAVFELLDGEHLPSSSPSHDGLSSPSHSGASPISPYSAASPSGDEALVSLCNTDAPMANFDDFSSGVLSQEFAFPDSAMEFDLGTSAPASLLSVDLGPMDTAMDTTMDPLMPSSDLGVAAAHCLPAPTMTTTTTKPSVDQKPTKSIKKRKPTRKAKKVAPSSLANKMDLNFTREEVLNMTCEQLDRIVENIQLTRELTKEEDQEVRKHRRLIKNRESAAASRKRKRGMVEELETKLSAYKTENDSLKENLARLSKENEELRERLAIATGNSAWRLGRGNMPSAKAGLCLMVVLLSFGLVFNQFQPSTGSGDLASALANYQFPAVDTFGRVAPELGGALSLPQAAHSELASPARRQLLSAGRGYSVIVDEDRKDPAVIEPMVIEQNDPTITVDHRFNPNTTYITILDGKQEGRPLNDSFPEDGSPFLIELIIPTESAAAEEEMLEYETSLEITCKVIETRLSTHVLGSRGELSSSPAQGTGTLTVM